MMQKKQELLMKHKNMDICEQLIGWIMDEVVDPTGKYRFDGQANRLRDNHFDE